MWPHKNGLGIQLSYGVQGNATLDPDAVFPRSFDGPSKILRRIRGPRIPLIKSQQVSGINTESSSSSTLSSSSNQYVPESLARSLEDEASALTQDHIYNPSIGTLTAIHSVKTKNGYKYTPVMAYTTGDSGTILNVAPLASKEVQIKSNQSSSARIPILRPPMQVEFAEPILQISFSKIEVPLDMVPTYLLVRTQSRVYILICEKTPASSQLQSRKTNDIEIVIIDELKPADLNGACFADASFNPYDFTQFAVVDFEGSFAIWSMNSRKKVVHKLKQIVKDCLAAVDSSLSIWRRIEWLNESKVVFILSRCSLILYNIGKHEALHLITSNTWSRIRDYWRCGSGKYAFLLTSKEIIWLLVDSGLKRLLSWKHFLDGNDPSLKLSVTEMNPDQFTCMIFSEISSLIFVFNFLMSLKGPKMTQDPYYIRCQKEVHQLILYNCGKGFYVGDPNRINEDDHDENEEDEPLNKIFCLLQVKTDHTVSLDLYDVHVYEKTQSSPPLNAIDIADNSTDDLNLEDIRNREVGGSKPKLFKRLKKFEISSLANSIIMESEITNAEKDVENIQSYAYKLGKNGRKLQSKRGYVSLLDLTKEVPSVAENLDEFDTMIEQLSSFFEHQDIDVCNFVSSIAMPDYDQQKPEKIEELSNKLNDHYRTNGLERFNKKMHLNEAAIVLGAATVRVKSRKDAILDGDKLTEKELEETQSKLIKNVLAKWDMDPTTPWISTVPDSVSQRSQILRNGSKLGMVHNQQKNVDPIVIRLSQSSQMPQIRLSQTPFIRPKPRELQVPRTQHSSQLETQDTNLSQDLSQNQGIVSQSQSQSQKRSQPLSQKKRKKKKKGGFA